MTKVRRTLGEWGERLAAAYLVANGMVLLDRNWRTPTGEIDIVARDGETVVFCEVKTRRTKAYGEACEAVTPLKTMRLRQLAMQWLAISRIRPRDVRFDVVSVNVVGRRPQIDHIRGAF